MKNYDDYLKSISGQGIEEEQIENSNENEIKLQEDVLENRTNDIINFEVKTKEKKSNNLSKNIGVAVLSLAIISGTFGAGLGAGGLLSGRYNTPVAIETSASTDNVTFESLANTVTSSPLNSVSEIYDKVNTSVVSINVKAQYENMFNGVSNVSGAGSGIIFKEDADKIYIVTNYHVVDSAVEISISIDDNINVKASKVGGDQSNDIAIISVKKGDLMAAGVKDYSLATLGNSDNAKIGDNAVAVGNAMGQGKTATAGIISSLSKQIQTPTGQMLTVIQTDAAINSGNSGGALVNDRGEVIGVNTAKLTSSYNESVEGMGFAIPSNKVSELINQIFEQANTDTKTPYLGVELVPITEEIKTSYNLPSLGVYINNVLSNSSASESGLLVGDIITGINGAKITTFEELKENVNKYKVGDTIKMDIIRDGKTTMTIDVKLKSKYDTSGF